MNRALLILTYTILADAAISEIPCLTWEMTPDKLDIICRLHNVVLPVSIYDMYGQEHGKCVFKNVSAQCSSFNKFGNITASYLKGEFKLSITNITRSLVKGEWRCVQGTQTYKTVISPSAGIISSTQVFLTGRISHQSSMETVHLSCFSCREPDGNNVEFLLNYHSVVNVRYDHVTKSCRHKYGECNPNLCSCSHSGNLYHYTFEFTNITTEISFSCGMSFVDKLISTRFLKFSNLIFNGTEFRSNGSETEITKAPEKQDYPHGRSDNETDKRPSLPETEAVNLNKNGLKWIFIGVAVVLPVLLTVIIVCCRLRITRKKKELVKEDIDETEIPKEPLLGITDFNTIDEISTDIVKDPKVKVEDCSDPYSNIIDIHVRAPILENTNRAEMVEKILQMFDQENNSGITFKQGIDIHTQDGENNTVLDIELQNDESQHKYTDIDKGQDHTKISSVAGDSIDDSNVYATPFVRSTTPPSTAADENVTKDQTTDHRIVEVQKKPDINIKPVPKPRLSPINSFRDEEKKSAKSTKPNRIEDSAVSVTSISPPNPTSRESNTLSPELKRKHHNLPDLHEKEIDSLPPLPAKTDYLQIPPRKCMSSSADKVVTDLPTVKALSQEPLDNPPPCDDDTGPALDKRPSEVELVFISSVLVPKEKNAFFAICAVWSNDHYIFIDRNNRMILMYNHKTGEIKSKDLRNEPFSMGIIHKNNVAISFPERQEIDIYAVTTCNTFKFIKVIKAHGKCFTLTKKDDETLLVYIEEKGIHSFNMSKEGLKSLDIQIPSFVPHSDDICARKNRLYHMSRSTRSVCCYDMNGCMLWDFNGYIKTPTALTCDKFGNVYVTDFTSHNLYFISADGQSYKTLLGRKEKLWFPTFVYYCMKRKCMLIVNRDNGYAASYSIKY